MKWSVGVLECWGNGSFLPMLQDSTTPVPHFSKMSPPRFALGTRPSQSRVIISFTTGARSKAECWSIGMLGRERCKSQQSITPSLHHSITPSLQFPIGGWNGVAPCPPVFQTSALLRELSSPLGEVFSVQFSKIHGSRFIVQDSVQRPKFSVQSSKFGVQSSGVSDWSFRAVTLRGLSVIGRPLCF